MTTRRILLTGATGFLGGALLAELLARGHGAELLLLIRAASADEGLARTHESLDRFEVPATQRMGIGADAIITGDLADVAAFAGDGRLDGVTHVINSAAIATFSNNPKIWPINVDGTFAFAQRMARVAGLQRFVHVGTAMACGPDRPSPIAESWEFPPPEVHLVPYTNSKAEIERRLRTELPGLPMVVVRPSIIVGHSRLGCRPSTSIFWVLRMAQILEAFTCSLEERVDIVPVDWCAQAIVTLALKERLAHDLYHVSAGDSACTFGEVDVALAAGYGVEPVGARFRVVEEQDLPQLAQALERKIGEVNRRVLLRAMRLYGGFAELNYVFDNHRLLAEGVPPPPRLPDYLPLCAVTAAAIPFAEQMQWDFK